MLIGRRSFLRGLIAAPIIVSPGIIMPINPRHMIVLLDRKYGMCDVLAEGAMVIYGYDPFGERIVETILPGKCGQKHFGLIDSIEYMGQKAIGKHPMIGITGSFTGINMGNPRSWALRGHD